MAIFYDEDSGLRYHFENLPIELKNKIIESGVDIHSVQELENLAQRMRDAVQ